MGTSREVVMPGLKVLARCMLFPLIALILVACANDPPDASLTIVDAAFDLVSDLPPDWSGQDAEPADHGLGADATVPADIIDLAPNDGLPPPDDHGPEVSLDLVPDLSPGCLDGQQCPEGQQCLLPDGLCVECLDFSDCENDNPCTFDFCSEDNECSHKPVDEPCGDGDPCSVGDHCFEGDCIAIEWLDCDDGNPCTQDVCIEDGCVHPVFNGPCDDSDPCTVGDACVDGMCQPGTGQKQCDDGNPCTANFCAPEEGCQVEPLDVPCDDSDVCTDQDQCKGGVCVGKPADCGDGNPCTFDYCEPGLGCLQDILAGAPCDDGLACTQGDKCQADAECTGEAVDCDDGNPCTYDHCSNEGAGCVFELLDEVPCSDSDECTVGDVCVDGQCLGAPKDCDDGNDCTVDGCEQPAGVCLNEVETGAGCSDGNPCTKGDVCLEDGACQPGPAALVCDDSNPCTTDTCAPEQGCVFANDDGLACDDGDLCTLDDTCAGGVCGGQQLPCPSDDPCTVSECSPDSGQCVEILLTGGPCDDSDECTQDDACSNGACLGQPALCIDNNSCTEDGCNPVAGCTFTPLTGQACDDSDVCTSNDKCSGQGKCKGSPISCDDGKQCTIDACDPLAGCTNVPATGQPCDDGNACTSNDKCKQNGQCAGGGGGCNDNDPCTEDSCTPAVGCSHTPLNGTPCDDGDGCTVSDQCTNGLCGGQANTCDDANDCTQDSCAEGQCQHVNLPGSQCNSCYDHCGLIKYDPCKCDKWCQYYKDCCADVCNFCQHYFC